MPTGTESLTACAACGGAELRPFVHKDGWDYVRCAGCGFVVVAPMPSQGELNALYQSAPVAGTAYPKARSRHRRALLRALRLAPWVWRRRVIDLGCGGGFMAGAFAHFARASHGLDIDVEAIAYARRRYPRCVFHQASFDRFVPDGRYDFVYSSELIEHVARLDEYMDLVRRLTAPGGHVFITTPDIGSPRVPADVTRWDVFGPPYHVQFFDERALATLFARYGFTTLRRFPDRKAGLKMLFRREAA